MREIRTLRATWRGLETWCGSGPGATPARQSSPLPMSGMWKRSHGGTIEAPPNERGGNRYVLPNATAPHLDSTIHDRVEPTIGPVMSAFPRSPPLFGAARFGDGPRAEVESARRLPVRLHDHGERRWLWLHESGNCVKVPPAGAEP